MPETAPIHDPDAVLTEHQSGLCILTLNRPQRLNALNAGMLRLLHAHLSACAADDSIRTIVLTGAGKGFCAGQDLNDRDPRKLTAPLDLEAIQKDLFHPLILLMRQMPKPVIVAVNGIAAGAGSSLALAGDLVLAASSAKFVQSFVKVGLSVNEGGGWHLVKALGPMRARALLLKGEALTAEDAAKLGLITSCLPDAELMQAALKLAAQLASGPAKAHAAIKAAINAAMQASNFESYLQVEAALQGEAGFSADYREGVLSFLERRPAQFKGN